MTNTTVGLTNINLLTRAQFNSIETLNANELYAVEANDLCMPSDSYVDLTLAPSGSTYTAPAAGWFFFNRAASSNQYVVFENQNTGIGLNITSVNSSSVRCLFPVRKGDVVLCSYTASGTLNFFRFYYAEGAI